MRNETLNTCGPVDDWETDGHRLTAHHARGLTLIEATAVDILRVRVVPDGRPTEQRPWSPVLELPPAELGVTRGDGTLSLDTGLIQARLDLGTGALAFATPDGRPYAGDLGPAGWREVALTETALEHMPEPDLPPGQARIGVFLDKRMAPDEGYFGFGQRTGRLDRRHRRLTHWTVDRSTPGHCRGNDNMYQAHPLFLAAGDGHAWGLYMNTTWYSAFDVGHARDDVLTLFTLGGELDYYLFPGPTPAAVVEQLTRLTGRPALPPLWALGYHQSRWSYASAAEVREIARQFRERRLPLDVIHLDIDYMDGYRVFTWDAERFPDPAGLVEELHAQGIRAVTIVDPGVKRELGAGYAVADAGAAAGHFVRDPGGELFTGFVWPGESLFPDFTREATRRWWGDLHQVLAEAGIDGIWCDMNEPAIGDRPLGTRGGRDRPIPLSAPQGDGGEAIHAETHNLYGSLMARAAWEGQIRLRPGRRPWVLTRSAFAGVQRFAASWMGDNSSWWEHLEMSLPQLASMGLAGSPHVGVDVGGFYHNCFPELYARWMELAAFYPFMRGHAHTRARPQEPWAFNEATEALARQALELRYRLLPYLYSLAHQAERTGAPLLRPLLYDFPAERSLHQIEDQAMLGPALMIAPVLQPGVIRRLVELPPGTWYDLHSGALVGPGPLVAEAPLGRTPVFVRGGFVLPLGNMRQSTAEPLRTLTLEAYPDPSGGEGFTLIEDDGETFAYRDGEVAETDLAVEAAEGAVQLTIGERRGHWRPHPREFLVRLHLGAPPGEVCLDGQATDAWRWDPVGQAAELRLTDSGRGTRIEAGLTR